MAPRCLGFWFQNVLCVSYFTGRTIRKVISFFAAYPSACFCFVFVYLTFLCTRIPLPSRYFALHYYYYNFFLGGGGISPPPPIPTHPFQVWTSPAAKGEGNISGDLISGWLWRITENGGLMLFTVPDLISRIDWHSMATWREHPARLERWTPQNWGVASVACSTSLDCALLEC